MPKKISPLGPKELATLNRVISACAETEELCGRCTACNIDVDKERQANLERMELAKALKRQFFPKEP